MRGQGAECIEGVAGMFDSAVAQNELLMEGVFTKEHTVVRRNRCLSSGTSGEHLAHRDGGVVCVLAPRIVGGNVGIF